MDKLKPFLSDEELIAEMERRAGCGYTPAAKAVYLQAANRLRELTRPGVEQSVEDER